MECAAFDINSVAMIMETLDEDKVFGEFGEDGAEGEEADGVPGSMTISGSDNLDGFKK